MGDRLLPAGPRAFARASIGAHRVELRAATGRTQDRRGPRCHRARRRRRAVMRTAVAVLGTYQTAFKTHHPEHTFAEQAQIAAAGALRDAGMSPDDIDAIVFSLAPTWFMGVADADRWCIDEIF